MSSNAAATEAEPNTALDVSYWPNFKLVLAANPTKFSHENMSCPICLQPLTPERVELVAETGICHGIDILPCGHVFGAKCIASWLEGNEDKTCPSCRTRLTHPTCGQEVERFPLQSSVDVILAPLTISEGGRIPNNHTRCSLRPYLMFLMEKITECIPQAWMAEAGDSLVIRVSYAWGGEEDFVFDFDYGDQDEPHDVEVTVQKTVHIIPIACPLFPNQDRAVAFDVREDQAAEN